VGRFGDTAYGSWEVDGETNTPVYVFRGGLCPSPGTNATCVDILNRTAVHAIGNDRHQLYLFSDGSASLRQDEGGPKLLNAYESSSRQFGGAAGFVTTVAPAKAELLASTVVDSANQQNTPAPLNLVFGTGFGRRVVVPNASSIFSVEATLVAPFGDDSVVLSIVKLQGVPSTMAAYTEAWSATRTQFNAAGTQSPLLHKFTTIVDGLSRAVGLLDTPVVVPVAAGSAVLTARAGTGLQRDAPPPLPTPSINDPSPRGTFFVCVSCSGSGLASFSTQAAKGVRRWWTH